MQIPSSLRGFLEKSRVGYQIICQPGATSTRQLAAALSVPLEQVAKASFVSDGEHSLVVVVPFGRQVDFSLLSDALHRDLKHTDNIQHADICHECEHDVLPALGAFWQLPVIVDKSLRQHDEVYVESGNHLSLVKLSQSAFMRLQSTAVTFDVSMALVDEHEESPAEHDVYHLLGTVGLAGQSLGMPPLLDIKSRIEFLDELPAMPTMAAKLMWVRNKADASLRDFSVVIEQDPSLAAQIMKGASASFYGYGKRITSIQDAVNVVLGFDSSLHMALGLAIGRSFRTTAHGPFGLDAFWRKALYTANLVEMLAKRMPVDKRPEVGLAYLSGLLHDFGFLLLGHLFPQEFAIFNRIVDEQPDERLSELETHMLGVTHGEVAGWLMKAWGMPGEVLVAIQEHHNESYQGEHAIYARLILLADRLLARNGFVDTDKATLPTSLIASCGLRVEDIEFAIDRLLVNGTELDGLAQQLAA